MSDKKTIYIAGPMSGLPNDNHEAFHYAESLLIARGYAVINPAHNNIGDTSGMTELEIWRAYMRISVMQVAASDEVYMLKGWERSSGAQIEYYLATHLGLDVSGE